MKDYAPRRVRAAFALAFALAALAAVSAPARAQSSTGSPNLVISQIYTRGGENGAAHPNDFVELFNRGTNTVDLSQYSLQIRSMEGNVTTSVTVTFVSSQGGIPIQPGQYRTVNIIQPPPGPFPIPPSTLGPTGKIAIVRNKEPLPQVDCPLGQDPDIEDYVGYGGATCFEGTGPAPSPTLAMAVFRNNNGCSDTDNNGADFTLAGAPNPRNFTGAPLTPCGLPQGTSTFKFMTSAILASESASSLLVTVTRTGGDLSQPATVDYATADGTAIERKDYTTAAGTLRFAAGETSKSFHVLINNDVFAEGGSEFFDLHLSNPTGNAVLADPSGMRITINDNDATNGTTNPSDDPTFFVRTHYADFLGREPDQAGLDFWVGNITSCGSDAQCAQVKRVNVSAAFFFAIEFQETGYYAYRLYKASFPDSAARPRGFPTYREFIRDMTNANRGVIVGVGNWEEILNVNKRLHTEDFVTRAEFLARYPASLTPAQFVDALNANADNPLSPSERDAVVNDLAAAGNTTAARAAALSRVADDADFRQAELNRAFVLMQYFGYLRRSPNAAPDTNFDGYDFWLGKLNQFNGNYVDAEMVRAFIESIEYRQRFGQ